MTCQQRKRAVAKMAWVKLEQALRGFVAKGSTGKFSLDSVFFSSNSIITAFDLKVGTQKTRRTFNSQMSNLQLNIDRVIEI